MIPRFSLYGQPDRWSGDVQEDPTGRWLKWLDVEEYVQYALMHGYVPPVVEESKPIVRKDVADSVTASEVLEDDLAIEERDLDLFDLMQSHNGVAAEDEV